MGDSIMSPNDQQSVYLFSICHSSQTCTCSQQPVVSFNQAASSLQFHICAESLSSESRLPWTPRPVICKCLVFIWPKAGLRSFNLVQQCSQTTLSCYQALWKAQTSGFWTFGEKKKSPGTSIKWYIQDVLYSQIFKNTRSCYKVGSQTSASLKKLPRLF